MLLACAEMLEYKLRNTLGRRLTEEKTNPV
jgi:hypothetical protein